MSKLLKVLKSWIHFLFIIVTTIVFVYQYFFDDSSKILIYCLGIFAISIWVHIIYSVIFFPIKFDQFIADTRLHKLFRVAASVIAVPAIIVFFITLTQNTSLSVHAEDLLYDDNMYNNVDNKGNVINDSTTTHLSNHQSKNGCIQKSPSLYWTVIYHFLDPGNQHMTTSKNGRGWAFVIAVLGIIFMGGLLITTMINFIDRRSMDYELGRRRYLPKLSFIKPFRKDSLIIFLGAHPMFKSIIKDYLNDTKNKNLSFLIVTTSNIENLRSILCTSLTPEQYNSIIFYSGHYAEQYEIKNIPFYAVKEIFLLGEDGDSNHDLNNMKTIELIKHEGNLKKLIKCNVLFEYQSTFSILQSKDRESIIGNLECIAYNYYELCAQQVMVNHIIDNKCDSKFKYLEGDDPMQENDTSYVHLVIVGMSKMGIAMALQAARIGHYPNFKVDVTDSPKRKNRTRITFIDKNADVEMNYFCSHYKELMELSRWRYIEDLNETANTSYFASSSISNDDGWVDNIMEKSSPYHHLCLNSNGSIDDSNFIDVEWQFIKGGIEQVGIQNYLREEVSRSKMTVAVCLPIVSESIAAALYLPNKVLSLSNSVLVYQRESDSLLKNLTDNNKKYGKIRAFGMMEDCRMEILYLDVAKYFHFVYDIACKFIGEEDNKKTVEYCKLKEELNKTDAEIELEWNKLGMWARWSNIYNAQCIVSKLHSYNANFNDSEDELLDKLGIPKNTEVNMEDEQKPYYKLAIVEHNRWNIEKLMSGFRPIFESEVSADKSLLKKEKGAHKNICSYEKLNKLDKDVQLIDIVYILAIPAISYIIKSKKNEKN